MKTTLNTRTLEAALRGAQFHGYRILFDPMTTLYSDIGKFITQFSNQVAPFLKADAYVCFGGLIVAGRGAWGVCSEYYKLNF